MLNNKTEFKEFILKYKNNLRDLESFVIRRYNFGESLDVFMEQPVWRGKKKQSQIQSCHFCVCHRNVTH